MGLFNLFIVKCPHCTKEFETKLGAEEDIEIPVEDTNLIKMEISLYKRLKIWYNRIVK